MQANINEGTEIKKEMDKKMFEELTYRKNVNQKMKSFYDTLNEKTDALFN